MKPEPASCPQCERRQPAAAPADRCVFCGAALAAADSGTAPEPESAAAMLQAFSAEAPAQQAELPRCHNCGAALATADSVCRECGHAERLYAPSAYPPVDSPVRPPGAGRLVAVVIVALLLLIALGNWALFRYGARHGDRARQVVSHSGVAPVWPPPAGPRITPAKPRSGG